MASVQSKTSSAQQWFMTLPVWDELDNYIYFGFALGLVYLLGIENNKELAGAIVGALLIKAKK